MRASEARYRAIVETAQEGIWVGNLDGHTLFANQKAADILGSSLHYLYDTNAAEILASDNPDRSAPGWPRAPNAVPRRTRSTTGTPMARRADCACPCRR